MKATLSIITTLLLLHHSSCYGFQLSSSSSRRSLPSSVLLKLSSQHGDGLLSVGKKYHNGDNDNTTTNNDNDNDAFVSSRRRLFDRALSSAAIASSIALSGNPSIASAKVVSLPISPSDTPTPPPTTTATTIPERDALLQAIDNNDDDAIAQAIEKLIPLSPLDGNSEKAKYDAALDGEWKLIWYNSCNFSPLLKLPSPFRPDSYQYFGAIASREVGEGRVAQGLTGGILSALGSDTELWLSSGAVGRIDRPSLLDIYPPFRFQLGVVPGSSGSEKPKRTIVDADSDAEFRKANARSEEAQLAPKNVYEQLYLEDGGRGSLRVSVIASGDPVIVGEMFVHQKL